MEPITLTYAPIMLEKIARLAADDSPEGRLKLARQHAAILGLALPGESSSSLSVVKAVQYGAHVTSKDTPWDYQFGLNADRSRVVVVSRSNPVVSPEQIPVRQEGSEPAGSLPIRYNPTDNSWLFADVLAPALDKKYTWDKAPRTLREHLQTIVEQPLLREHPNSHQWLLKKGVMVNVALNDVRHQSVVRLFLGEDFGNLRAVLIKGRGPSAIDDLMEWAGPVGSNALSGSPVLDLTLYYSRP